MKIDTAVQGTRFNKIPQPGDELDYTLRIRFLIDEYEELLSGPRLDAYYCNSCV